MANTTGPVASFAVHWGDDKIVLPLYSTAATYYPGAMMARNSSGYGVKCDDTAGIQFVGINAEGQNTTVFSGESSGDRSVLCKRPWRFAMAIAAAAAGEEGDAVYAKYDNEVAYSGVSNSILVGWVDEVLSATSVLINPIYGPLTNLSVANNTLTFSGATTANTVVFPDNLADALSFKQGANAYLTFNTTDTTGELMYASKPLRFIDNVGLKLGTGDDIVFTWDGTDLDVTQAAVNSSIKWGVDGDGIDHVFYGATASTSMTWDQSADSLIMTGAAPLVFTGTTGQPEIHLTDNLADALSIEISGSTDLLTFTTTNNAESVSPIGLRTRSSTAVAITGATTLTLADSGGIFTVGQGSAYDVDLPSPTSGPGCSYFFSLTAPAANNVTVTVAGAAATFVGSVITEGKIVVATGSTLTFASGVAVLGDSIEIRSIATNLYHVRAVSSIVDGITIS
jgi:hypothetical protein